jgi:uncharacterized membrane protein YphA (DoxX/SURF4 family)
MKLSEPVGSAQIGPLWIRVSIGLYFLLAGLGKIDKLPLFVEQVQSFGILPNEFAALYAMLLPYVEVLSGLLLILGLWCRLASSLVAFMLVSFIIAFGVFPNSLMFFNKDIILFAGAISLLYTGSGAFSLDKALKYT